VTPLAVFNPADNLSRHLLSRSPGQALVELAFVLPVLFGVSVVLLQVGVLFMVYLNLVHATRDVGRWLAVHPDTDDAALQTYILNNLPSNISSTGLTFDFSSADPNDWPWSPRCQSLSTGRCATRVSGAPQRVGLAYDVAPHVFLPTSVNFGWWSTAVPTTIPRYQYYVMIEAR
jgi:Flp pilus assembly protein TadG